MGDRENKRETERSKGGENAERGKEERDSERDSERERERWLGNMKHLQQTNHHQKSRTSFDSGVIHS